MNTRNTIYKATSQKIHNFWLNVYLKISLRLLGVKLLKNKYTSVLIED